MGQAFLGIDIAKSNFHAAILVDERFGSKSFPNTPKGFAQLDAWLRNRRVDRVHACLEATGKYSEALALHLHAAGHVVSVVNAARIKGFAHSELLRTKTDAVDAALIARFCKALTPEPWTPAAPEMRELQSLIRRLASLDEARQQERNRADTPDEATLVSRSIAEHIAYLDDHCPSVPTSASFTGGFLAFPGSSGVDN